MITSDFDFNPLRVKLEPYGSFFDVTDSKNNCHVRNWLVFNRNETILYAIHQQAEKHIDINCKVTFGFKYRTRMKNKLCPFFELCNVNQKLGSCY